jgi:D-sedoheptulose 7-phosphate isomerase
MKQIITQILNDSLKVKQESIETQVLKLEQCAQTMAECLASGHKILIFGNGGSAADAQHLAAEFVNRFQIERPPLAAIALSTDTSIITSIGNDYDYNEIFSKQIKAIGKKHDIAWGISTSGNSANVVDALSVAREMALTTIGMTGEGGGKTAAYSDILLPVHSCITARIQETHITMGHILCDLVDRILFP